jgi:hypothetical protein
MSYLSKAVVSQNVKLQHGGRAKIKSSHRFDGAD